MDDAINPTQNEVEIPAYDENTVDSLFAEFEQGAEDNSEFEQGADDNSEVDDTDTDVGKNGEETPAPAATPAEQTTTESEPKAEADPAPAEPPKATDAPAGAFFTDVEALASKIGLTGVEKAKILGIARFITERATGKDLEAAAAESGLKALLSAQPEPATPAPAPTAKPAQSGKEHLTSAVPRQVGTGDGMSTEEIKMARDLFGDDMSEKEIRDLYRRAVK